MAVLYPLESRMQQTKSRAKKIILVVWIKPCCVASPFLYPSEAFENTLQSDYGVIKRLTCFISLPENIRRGYYTFLFIFIYILPLSFIVGTCFKVARCLLKDIPVHRQGSIRRQEASRRKVPMSCLVTQSSSDSGSCGQSDTSQRTACTVDHRSGSSHFRSFIKKRPSKKIIVQYIKRNGETKCSDKLQEEARFTPRAQPEKCRGHKRFKKCSSSTGDLTLLNNISDSNSPLSSHKKWLSCLDLNSHSTEMF